MKLPTGKIPPHILKRLLGFNVGRVAKDPRVIVGPGIGEDAAVIDQGGPKYLVVKTDPITFAADQIGSYAVHVNANDIAAMGATPKWFLATLLLPDDKTIEADAEQIFTDILNTCDALSITLVGGHTEVTCNLDRPIVVGQMLGEVEKHKLVRTSGAKIGDAIILTKGLAIEGTSILAREKEKELAGILSPKALERAKKYLNYPGISVVQDALIACEAGEVHCMHDPTEGGVATALHEIAVASNIGIQIFEKEILVSSETLDICKHFKINPLGLISSGALLLTASKETASAIIKTLQHKNIPAHVIGEVLDPSCGIKIFAEGKLNNIPMFDRDELTRAL